MFEKILPSIIEIIAVFIGLGVAFARSGLTALIRERVKNTTAQSALAFLADTAADTVLAFKQTTVDELKKKHASGAMTTDDYKAALSRAKDEAVRRVLDATGEKLKNGLGLPLPQVRQLVDGTVEAAIAKTKNPH